MIAGTKTIRRCHKNSVSNREDSSEYDLLEGACKLVPWAEVLSAEIGVRQGQGSKIILDSFKDKKHWHIGIDPYGNLNYQHYVTYLV